MKNFRRNQYLSVLLLLGISISACNKDFSSDDPFPDEYKPSLYIGSDNRIFYSFDAFTYEKNWEFTAAAAIKSTPLIYKDYVILIDAAGNMYKLDRMHGRLEEKRSIGASVLASPTSNDSAIFVATTDGRMMSIKGDDIDGAPYWTTSGLNSMAASPILKMINTATPEMGIIGANQMGEVFALRVSNGTQIWKRNVSASAPIVSSPSATESTIFIGSLNGRMYKLNTVTGSTIWSFVTDGPITSSPISFGGNVMFGSADRNFYSVDSLTGTLRWKILTEDKVESSPIFDNQFVYFGSNDMHIYCVDIIHGLLQWKKRTFSVVKSSPIVFNRQLFAGTHDKNLYILNVDSGTTQNLLDIKGQMETSPVIDNISQVYYPSISGKILRK